MYAEYFNRMHFAFLEQYKDTIYIMSNLRDECHANI